MDGKLRNMTSVYITKGDKMLLREACGLYRAASILMSRGAHFDCAVSVGKIHYLHRGG